MKPVAILFLWFLLMFYPADAPASEPFSWHLGSEGGFYISDMLGNRLLTRLIGRLQYTNTFDHNFITLNARLAPELYGFSFSASTLKLSGQMNFGQRLPDFTWQTRLSARHYSYQSDQYNDVSFTVFQMGADLTRPISAKLILGTALDYFYRDNSRRPRNQLDSYAFSPFAGYRFNRANYLTLELTMERFHIMRSFAAEGLTANSGWRIGPKLGFNHRSGYLLSLTWQFIHHSADAILSDHWENRLDLLWGRMLGGKGSLFFYLNYQFRPRAEENVPVELTYTPVNNENWIHIKAGYDVSRTTELYARFGYTRDELVYKKQDLSGWQFLLGFNLRY